MAALEWTVMQPHNNYLQSQNKNVAAPYQTPSSKTTVATGTTVLRQNNRFVCCNEVVDLKKLHDDH